MLSHSAVLLDNLLYGCGTLLKQTSAAVFKAGGQSYGKRFHCETTQVTALQT